MEVEHQEPVKNVHGDELLLGRASWDARDRSLKYAWPDKNGRRGRGGELPVSAIPQAVVFAARKSYLTRAQMGSIIKELVDVLADERSG